MLRLLIPVGILMSPALVSAGENCTCRYKDAEVSEGQTACIRTPNGPQMARCEKVLNNTSWKFLEQPCPTASLNKNGIMNRIDSQAPKIFLEKAG